MEDLSYLYGRKEDILSQEEEEVVVVVDATDAQTFDNKSVTANFTVGRNI